MVEKLKLTTANLEKISEKLKNTSNKCMGIVECKQAPSSFYSRHNNDENEADTFGNKIHAASCRKANFNAETDPAKIFVKQLLRLPVSELKEKDENFSAWTATIADLRGDNPIKLTKKQMILLSRRAQAIRINTLLAWLMKEYPACFLKGRPKPLKIGIIDDIRAVLPPKASRILLKKALKHYTSTKNYIRTLVVNPYRYDLSGKEAGVVSKEEKAQALEKLNAFRPNKSKNDFQFYDEEEYDNRFNR